LNHAAVGKFCHFTAERIYFAHKVPFRKPTYSRIAGKRTYAVGIESYHQRRKPKSFYCEGGLNARVSAADYYAVAVHIFILVFKGGTRCLLVKKRII
jgi:hypothetical protein